MLVEFGYIEVNLQDGSLSVACTAPIGIIEKLSKFGKEDMKLIIDDQNRAFVEMPKEMFEEESHDK